MYLKNMYTYVPIREHVGEAEVFMITERMQI